jgi:hypothetical protein
MNFCRYISYTYCNDPPSLGGVECREVHATFFARDDKPTGPIKGEAALERGRRPM